KLGHGGEYFFAERQLVQPIDLPADTLFLSERLFEYLEERRKLRAWRLNAEQLGLMVPRQQKVEEAHAVGVLLGALEPQPGRRTGKIVVLAPACHRQVRERRRKLVGHLLVDGLEHRRGHEVTPSANSSA